jgi:hypothetical protein
MRVHYVARVSTRLRAAALLVLAALSIVAHGRDASADDDDEEESARPHVPLPEPIFTETVTDIDGNEAGEIEFEANASDFRARRGGAYALDTSIEAEWIVHPRLGLRIEPSFGWDRDALSANGQLGVGAGAALKLLQDFEHDFFLHLELYARLPWDESPIVQPGDPALPLATDLRAGFRRGPITFRWGAGFGAFGDAEHLPLRGSIAVLTSFDGGGRFGFFGVELDADGARTAPFVAAINIEPNLVPAGIPLRLGLALPWAINERDDRPSMGFFVRIFYESSREIEFARATH